MIRPPHECRAGFNGAWKLPVKAELLKERAAKSDAKPEDKAKALLIDGR